jgi:protein-disulfide isomerase
MTSNQKPTRSEQREAAREKARQLREQNQKREKRTRLFLQLGVVAGSLAIFGGIAGFIWVQAQNEANRPIVGDAPENMIFNDGIKIGVGLQAFTNVKTPTPDTEGPIPNIQVFVDYLCPVCQAFDVPNSAQIRSWVDTGAATVQIHPISFLDRASTNQYSSRAANAVACVANYEPDAFFDMHTILLERQPSEGQAGWNNDVLTDFAREAGATGEDVAACINAKSFDGWVEQVTQRTLSTPQADSGVQVTGTPAVFVDGRQYSWTTGEELVSAERFAQFVQLASAQ